MTEREPDRSKRTVKQSNAASCSWVLAPAKLAALRSFSASPALNLETRIGPTRNLALLTFFAFRMASSTPGQEWIERSLQRHSAHLYRVSLTCFRHQVLVWLYVECRRVHRSSSAQLLSTKKKLSESHTSTGLESTKICARPTESRTSRCAPSAFAGAVGVRAITPANERSARRVTAELATLGLADSRRFSPSVDARGETTCGRAAAALFLVLLGTRHATGAPSKLDTLNILNTVMSVVSAS